MRVSALCVLSVVCAAAFAGPRVAVAQSNKVAAEALFEEGRRLMREGKTSEACPKFAESQRLDPAVGTLLNLANCYETSGRTASAWATYKEAASAASAAGRAENQKTAEKRAAALAPKLARLTIVAPALDGLSIKRDGADVQKAEVGVAIPVDPGSHTVSASAPQKKAWSTTINVDKEGAALTVTIPALEDAPVAPPPPVPSAAPPPPPPPPPAAPPPERPAGDGGSSQRTIGLVVGGVGVVGLGVGTIFALSAKSKYDASLDHCPRDKNLCTPEGVSQRDDARSKGNIATVGFGLGAAALVTGSVLFFTAPGGKESSALQIAPTLGGATMRGSF